MSKMYKIVFHWVFLAITMAISACGETEIIVPRATDILSDRIVLIEDFTGVRCPNCPNASREITALTNRFPKNVVAVAYHTSFLGTPITTAGYQSKYDFRTPEGEQLEGLMGYYLGKPAVTMNRKKYNDGEEFLLTSTSILGNIEKELLSVPKAELVIDNQYDAGLRKLTSTITIDPKTLSSGTFRLHAMVVESKIIDSQEDNTEYKKDYEHNHVFRAMLSDLEGDDIGASFTPGKPITRTYSFTLPPEAGWWVDRNSSIVAFITDLNQKTYQVGSVIQAAEAGITQ